MSPSRRLLLSLLTIVAVRSPTSAQAGGFETDPAWYSGPGNLTHVVAFGDVDRDGDLDMVCGNSREPNTLYLNEGGTFAATPAWSSEAAEATTALALGDVDGDGDLDLVCGNWGPGGKNALYLNEGGTFETSPAWTSDPANDTFGVALGDIDTDGDLDLVCGNGYVVTTGQSNTVYLNEEGTFQATPAWISDPAYPTRSVALGDVDGDGDIDLVCANWRQGTEGEVNTLYLNVAGTLGQAPAWSSGLKNRTRVVALGDVDGDGDLDLACANHADRKTLYTNDGGTFRLTPSWSSDDSTATFSMALGDVDADGDLDMVCGNWQQSNTLYLNEGGAFTATPTWFSGLANQTYGVALGDVDGDGDLDLACASWIQANTLYLGEGKSFGEAPVWTANTASDTRVVVVGDVDADGGLDLICGNDGQRNTLYLNQGNSLAVAPSWFSDPRNSTRSAALGDVDGDGDLDLACGNWRQSNTLYFNQNGMLSTTPAWSSEPMSQTRAVAFGDVDGDGDLDMVCGNSGDPNTLYLNEGSVFTSMPTWSSDPAESTNATALGDVDGDGDLDLVCGNWLQSNTLYINDGGTFSRTPSWSSEPANKTAAVALGDIDGDGDLDLVCGNASRSNAVYVNHAGELSRSPTWSSGPANVTLGVALGDVDGDGDLDLACGNWSGNWPQSNTLYLNQGGTFAVTPAWISGSTDLTWAVALGDVDRDGDLDLVCGNASGSFNERRNTVYQGFRGPAYKGDPTAPTNHLPHNPAHLRDVHAQPDENLLTVHFRAVDVDSDPVWILPEFQYEGVASWFPVDILGGADLVGPLPSSRDGVASEFDWDASRVPFDNRDVILRLRTISNPSRVGLIRQVPSYLLHVGQLTPSRPQLAVLANGLDFTSVTIGDTSAVVLDLSNVGNQPLTVSGITTPPDLETFSTLPLVVSPGTTEQVEILFAPTKPSTLAGFITVQSDDPTNQNHTILIQGTALDLTFETNALAPGKDTPLGEALTIQVIPADGVRIEDGSLYARPVGDLFLPPIELNASGSSLVGQIPGTAVVESGVEYYVVVENSGVFRTGPPGAPDSVFFQAVSAPETISVTILANAGNDVVIGLDASVQVLLDDGVEYVDGNLHYREGGRETFQTAGFQANDRLLSATVPAEAVGPRGIEYWAEVETATTVLTDPPTDPSGLPHVATTVVPALSEGVDHPGGQYRMVSVPLVFESDVDVTLEDLLSDDAAFGPYDHAQWRAFRYSEGEYHELVAGVPTEEHAVRPGRGFWLISRDENHIDTGPVRGGSTPTDTPYAVVLTPGWNQIGSPFAFPVSWTPTPLAPDVGPLQAWNADEGEYADATTLTPFESYFIKSAQPETLWIPAIERDERLTVRGEELLPTWEFRLTAAGAEGASNVSLGFHAEAVAGFDVLDREKPPPPPGPGVSLAVANRDWRYHPGLYRRDIRDTRADGHTWSIELLTDERAEDVSLGGRWDAEPSDNLVLRLVDLEQSVSTDVRGDGEIEHYRLVSFGPERPYRLAILAGSPDYVENEGNALIELPALLSLGRNAPNPFRHATRVRFGLPEPTTVSLTIFNLHGRRVMRLVDREVLPAGYHAAIWDGRDSSGHRVASGIYFYRLDTDDAVKSRKMLVLR